MNNKSFDYNTLRSIICPDISWIDNLLQPDQGREEAHALLDMFVELSKLAKNRTRQVRQAVKLKKAMDFCISMTIKNKGTPDIQLKALEEFWTDVMAQINELGYVPEYDIETDRMILTKRELLDLAWKE